MTAYHILLDKNHPQFNEAILAIAIKHVESQGPDTAIGGGESLDGQERLVKAVVDLGWLEVQPWFGDGVFWVYEATNPLDPIVETWLDDNTSSIPPT
jgi:hypothetical protein